MSNHLLDRNATTQPRGSKGPVAKRRVSGRLWLTFGAIVVSVVALAVASMMNRPPARDAPAPGDTTAPEVPNHGTAPAPARGAHPH